MTRELALIVMIAAALLLLAAGVYGWSRRTKRDRGLTAPVGELPAGAVTRAEFHGLYVATTVHEEPLERLAIRGLAFRSRVDITIADAGVALDLTGQPRIVITRDRIESVDQATVAIDRVVEKDGLVRLVWRTTIADGTEQAVDTYLRAQDASAREVAAAITAILPEPTATTPTGSDA